MLSLAFYLFIGFPLMIFRLKKYAFKNFRTNRAVTEGVKNNFEPEVHKKIFVIRGTGYSISS